MTSSTSYRRLIDVETTSCVYWDNRHVGQYAFGQQQDGVKNTNIHKKCHRLLSHKHIANA